jgi:hypothetical protein
MSNSNGDLVIQYCWSWKHKVERLYGAPGRDSLLGVRRPLDIRVRESVELPDEVLVRPLRLLVGVRGLHTNQM